MLVRSQNRAFSRQAASTSPAMESEQEEQEEDGERRRREHESEHESDGGAAIPLHEGRGADTLWTCEGSLNLISGFHPVLRKKLVVLAGRRRENAFFLCFSKK